MKFTSAMGVIKNITVNLLATNTYLRSKMIPVEHIARVCHEANRAIQINNNEKVISLPFDELSKQQIRSAIRGVIKAQQGATPEQLHKAWCHDKYEDGWVYARIKSETRKTHPCLVSYEELPKEQRVKDKVFQVIVNALSLEG